MPAGRPSDYTPELMQIICGFIASGENLRRICQREDMPNPDTVYNWLRKYPEFADNYARAREARADARADRIDEISQKALSGEYKADAARVAIDAEKWQAGKENPKRYGDKLTLDGELKVSKMDDEELRVKLALLLAENGAAQCAMKAAFYADKELIQPPVNASPVNSHTEAPESEKTNAIVDKSDNPPA